MGFDYALVHLKYTIPPAIALTFAYRPLLTRLDLYKICFLIAIAVIATTPWDSYLIRRNIWTYPPSVIIGPRLFGIPAEEVFFFVVQTYNTTLLYLLLNKPVLPSSYLVGRKSRTSPAPYKSRCYTGQIIIAAAIGLSIVLIAQGREATYLGLILVWAGPFALLLWTLSYQFLIRLPYTSTIVPIALPTAYLWIVDTLALKRGTWAIEPGTKLGLHLWDGLEIEEAIFFAITNILIVFGLVTFDNAIGVLVTFPNLFPKVPTLPSPVMLVQALLTDTCKYDTTRIAGIQDAVNRLRCKSRSFYLASAVFSGRLRVDLILLYSFCRVADNLIDDAESRSEAEEWTRRLETYLNLAVLVKTGSTNENRAQLQEFVTCNFPKSCQAALMFLPFDHLSFPPLDMLLDGFKTDLQFHNGVAQGTSKTFPIDDEDKLVTYGSQVAGTIAELCLELVFHHTRHAAGIPPQSYFAECGRQMGIALQTVNIARDIEVDSSMSRVYIPTDWLKEEDLTPRDVLTDPNHPSIEKLRKRLLGKAFSIYRQNIGAIDQLPAEARGPMRVAIESYMEIGRVLCTKGFKVKHGRATVPKIRRIGVAWKALSKG